MPWAHARFTPAGDMMPCCKISHEFPKANINNTEFSTWWNNSHLQQLRQELHQGHASEYCQVCWNDESAGKSSLRQEYNKQLAKHTDLKKIYNASAWTNDQFPIALDLNLGNICNFKCIMCVPALSSRIQEEQTTYRSRFEQLKFIALGSKYNHDWPEQPRFQQLMTNLLPNLKLIEFKGGEPLLVRNVIQMIEAVPNKADVTIAITTNGSIELTNDFITQLQKFKHIWFFVSVDGIGDIGEYIRYGSKWSQVDATIQQLSKLPNCTFRISTVLQFFSPLSLPGILTYAKENNIEVELLQYIGDYAQYLSINAIPPGVMNQFRQYAQSNQMLLNYLDSYEFNPVLHQQCYDYITTLNNIRNNALSSVDALFDIELIKTR